MKKKTAKKTTKAKAEARVRTKAEIVSEVVLLRSMKPFVRKFTLFGDNNHAAIDAQIVTLEENLDDDDIADRYLPSDDEEESGKSIEIESSARDAMNWRDGTQDQSDPPSEGWKSLAVGGGWKG